MNKNKRDDCINTSHQRQQTADRNSNERQLTVICDIHCVIVHTTLQLSAIQQFTILE